MAAIYCGGFADAGTAVGALWPLHRSTAGAPTLGYLAAGIVVYAVMLLMKRMDGMLSKDSAVFTAIVMILVFGTTAGWQFHRWGSSRAA